MKSLVVGGLGFLGSHVVEALVARGDQVDIIDNLVTGRRDNIATVCDKVNLHSWDIDWNVSNDLIVNCDLLFYLAGRSSPALSIDAPNFDLSDTLSNFHRLLENIRFTSKKRPLIIFPSSAAVYGDYFGNPVTENTPCNPITPYGVNKLAAEKYLAVYCRQYGFRGASMRLFSVYGPRQRKQVVYNFIKQLHDHPDRLEIMGDGTQRRDFIYVTDVVQAMLTVINKGECQGEVYNVGSEYISTITDLANALTWLMDLEPKIEYTTQSRSSDFRFCVSSTYKLQRLDWPWPTWQWQGLQQTINWYEDEYGSK